MSKKRVFIIEDDLDIAKIMKYALEAEGHEVYTANDGKEGFEEIRHDPPDLVILDLALPGLCGEEVCRKIKRDKNLKDIPVIMVTAKSSDTDRVIGKVIGANRYMIKPFDVDELLSEVNSLTG
ncbi:MAG: response regulator [Candidatus Omnitrophota bacterium]